MKAIRPISLCLCLMLTLSACGSGAASTAPVSETAEAASESSAVSTAPAASADESQEYSAEVFAMDTYMSLKAYGAGADTALADISEMITDLDSRLSVTDESSEIYAVNHSGGSAVTVSETTADLLTKALALGNTTDGALELTIYPISRLWGFTTGDYQIPDQSEIDELLPLVDDSLVTVDGTSVTVPEDAELDLGAVAKGYAGDQAIELLGEAGISSALLNLGSSTIAAVGSKTDGSDWRIAIQDPDDTSAYAGVVSVSDLCVNTSGGYERYFEGDDGEIYWHILDPETGSPAKNGLISVTILSDSALQGDGLSTALFVKGLDGAISYWQEHGDFEFIVITEDHEIYLTQGAEAMFTPMGSYETAEIHVVTNET